MTDAGTEYEEQEGAFRSSWDIFSEGLTEFLRLKVNLVAFTLTILLILAAVLAPLLAPYDFAQVDPANGLQPPSWEHLMGTDQAGRDIFSRVLYGARTSMSIAVFTVAFGLITGVTYGAISGFFGGWVDEIMMRVVEIFMSIPGIVMALALVSVLGPSLPSIVLALSIRRIIQFARVTRGVVLGVSVLDYIAACRGLGMSNARIIFVHILPNCMGPIIVLASVLIGNVILTESALSFLGMGVQEPTPSLGTMIAKGNEFLIFAPWISVFPGLFLFLMMIAFNLLGDGIRDHFDPRGGSNV